MNIHIPKVAIVGRPNVGKSTLFNRLVRERKALVRKEMGTTRDRLYETISVDQHHFVLVDTGGHKIDESEPLSDQVNREVRFALDEADLIIFLIEKDAVTSEDFFIADIVKKSRKKTILVVNKVDHDDCGDINEFYQLALGEPIYISAEHNLNISELITLIKAEIPEVESFEENYYDYVLSIIGEPNAGKSTLLNQILKKERSIVSEIAGTTRDNIEELYQHEDKIILLRDTAGIKKKKKLKDLTSVFSLYKALSAIHESDVIILLFDAEKGPQKDTRQIFETIQDKGKSCFLVVNKWDLISEKEMHDYELDIKTKYGFLKHVPILFISAKTGRNVEKTLTFANELWLKHSIKCSTKQLNDFLQTIKGDKLPMATQLKYITQVGSCPPEFKIFGSRIHLLRDSHRSFIRNKLVQFFDLKGVSPFIKYVKG